MNKEDYEDRINNQNATFFNQDYRKSTTLKEDYENGVKLSGVDSAIPIEKRLAASTYQV